MARTKEQIKAYQRAYHAAHRDKIKAQQAANYAADRDDLMQDFVALVTSFTARLYGLRRSRRKTERLIKELAGNDS